MGMLLLGLGFLGLALQKAFYQALFVFLSPILLWVLAKLGLKIKRKCKKPAASTDHLEINTEVPAVAPSPEPQLSDPTLFGAPKASYLLKGILFAAAGWSLILYGCYIGGLDLWLWISTDEAFRWLSGSDESLGIIFRTPETVLNVPRSEDVWPYILFRVPLFIYLLLLGFILADLGAALVKQWRVLRLLCTSGAPKA